MPSQSIGKLLIIIGCACLLLGVLIYFGKFPGFLGKLPGDIRIERPNFSFYFPIGTSILVSVLLSLIFYILSRFK